MLRLTNVLNKLQLVSGPITHHVNYQAIRWRKPMWLGTAKSKIFRVPKRPVIPMEEQMEILRLFNNYRTSVKSLRKYLTLKYSTEFLTSEDPEELNRIFQEDYARCMEINNHWNEEQRLLREQRAAEMLEAELDFARKRVETELLNQDKIFQEAEEIVKREKVLSKDYITPENVDIAIDQALANTVDYNFALNLNGEKIFGRENNEIPQKLNLISDGIIFKLSIIFILQNLVSNIYYV